MEFLFYCIKTLAPVLGRKTYIRSGFKSHLRVPVLLKNSRRVMLHTARITKLLHHVCLSLSFSPITGIGFYKSWLSTSIYWKSRVFDLRHNHRFIYMMQRPKCNFSGGLGTTGNPKGRKSYGSGGLVRSLGTKRSYSSSTFIALACGSLEELVNLNKLDKQLVNNKLIHIIADPKVLILAYKTININIKNSTISEYSKTLNEIDLNWIKSTRKLLLAGKYKFKASRCVRINKKRILTINNPRDKMIQQAMYFVLNAIYDPSFLDVSHGSRLNRDIHTALKFIKLKFQGVKWYIKENIDKNFLSISHKILFNLLKKRISCNKFLTLVKRSLKVGFIEDGVHKNSNKGLFHGNITSPILNNIYLHELDIFVNGLCNNFNSNKSKKKKLYYIRYIDNLVVGIVGSKKDAVDIKKTVSSFLEKNLKLVLNNEKSVITYFRKKPIFFLDTLIRRNLKTEKNFKISKKIMQPILEAPIKDLFLKFTMDGFFKKRGDKFVPTKVGWLINLNHADILKYYNSIIKKVLNFYSLSNNRKSLINFVHGLKLSCARTLALKYKLRFASKVYKKFGSKLKCPNSGLELFTPNNFR